jgi:hypothetical protein
MVKSDYQFIGVFHSPTTVGVIVKKCRFIPFRNLITIQFYRFPFERISGAKGPDLPGGGNLRQAAVPGIIALRTQLTGFAISQIELFPQVLKLVAEPTLEQGLFVQVTHFVDIVKITDT